MLLLALLMLQTAPAPAAVAAAPAAAPDPMQAKLDECLDLAASDAQRGEVKAVAWRGEGGGYRARQCLGVAYANQGRWDSAAGALEQAAREAERERGGAAEIWARTGNAWLAAGDPAKARAALDAALASGSLLGLELGEAYLDRARARVAAKDLPGARGDLDHALESAASDPLTWLLSASLARLQGDLKRAKADIDEALRRSPDDANVQLEAGNIAALLQDEPGARAAWTRVIELAPGSDVAEKARGALAQFGAEQ